MSTRVVTVSPEDTLAEAAKCFVKNDIGAVPVVSDRGVCGIITDRDIVTRCVSKGLDPAEARVGDYMSTDVVLIQPSDYVDNAALMMKRQKVRRLPVVDNSQIVGIVSLGDIALEKKYDMEISSALTEISKPGDGPKARIFRKEK